MLRADGRDLLRRFRELAPSHPRIKVQRWSTPGTVLLKVQALPEATLVPCVDQAPPGWSLSGIDVHRGAAHLRFDSDRAGAGAVVVEAVPACSTDDAVRVPSDEEATQRYERVEAIGGRYQGTRSYVFDGGCVQYVFDTQQDGWSALGNEASNSLGFVTRDALAQRYSDMTGGLAGP